MDFEQIDGLFAGEMGYQTPKLDSRAAIIRDGKILLVQEMDGTWAMPGGWVDMDQTIKENTVKEAGKRPECLLLRCGWWQFRIETGIISLLMHIISARYLFYVNRWKENLKKI